MSTQPATEATSHGSSCDREIVGVLATKHPDSPKPLPVARLEDATMRDR